MNKKNGRRKAIAFTIAIIFSITSLSGFLGLTAFADEEIVVNTYQIFKPGSTTETLTSLSNNTRFDLRVTVTDSNGSGASGVTIRRIVDDFDGGTDITVSDFSSGSGQANYTILFKDLRYKGEGRNFQFSASYAGTSASAQGLIPISECKESDSSSSSSTSYSTSNAAPNIMITETTFNKDLKPGDTFDLNVVFRNTSSKIRIENIALTITPSEGLLSLEASSTNYYDILGTEGGKLLSTRIKVLDDVEVALQSVTFDFKYEYVADATTRSQGSFSEKITIPVKTEKKVDDDSEIATPNIIISKYEYGGIVSAGQTFLLNLELKNTSTNVPVENITMTLEPSEGLVLRSPSNSFYIPKIETGGTLSQSIEVRALPTIKPDNANIGVSFKSEYVHNEKRSQITNSEKMNINAYLPDRFEITPPQIPPEIQQGQDFAISFQYVNKGKSELANTTAELIGNVDSVQNVQNLGNLQSGASGTIDFFITPQEIGDLSVLIKITYEDTNTDLKEYNLPIALNVVPFEDPYAFNEMEMEGMMEEPPAEKPIGVFIAIGVLLLLAIAAIVIYQIRKRQKAKKLQWERELEDFMAEEAAEKAAAESVAVDEKEIPTKQTE